MLSKYKKQAQNRLFLQIKLGRILDILWAFLIWDDQRQRGASRIQRALME